MSALFDLRNEFNAIYQIFAKELGFLIRLIEVGVQKINGIMLYTYKTVVAAFLLTDKVN